MLVQGASEVLQTTWSAVQASISVILVLLYGYLARAYQLLSEEGERNTSKISVTLFLPALLFSEIGPLASWENLKQYWIIIIYALFFQLCSFLVGTLGVRVFKMPQWIVPCMVFNNVTSLPLLLLSSLADTGTLKPLMEKGDDMDELLSRGKVYLLIHALVCNLTRFGFGPYMLEPPKSSSDSDDGEDEDKRKRSHRHWAWTYSESPHKATPIHKHIHASLTTALPAQQLPSAYPAVQPYHPQSESSPLLYQTRVEGRRAKQVFLIVWDTAKDWLNPPLVGGMAAIIGGVVPFLHKAIFGESSPLKPVAKSISNLGDLYTVLQMFVLGAHLKSKRGSRPPVWPLIYLFVYRFAVMPVITGATVFGVRRLLDGKILSDPVLDFAMMIAPVGPPALTLAAIVEMSNADEGTDTAVAQTIVLSYILTPLISASVTGALDVVQRIHA